MPRLLKFDTARDGIKLEAKERISIDFFINGDRFSDEFIVIEKSSDKAIIGAATLQKLRMKLDFEHNAIIYDPKVTRLRIVYTYLIRKFIKLFPNQQETNLLKWIK